MLMHGAAAAAIAAFKQEIARTTFQVKVKH